MSQARFQKQQREKARREKAVAKEARRDERRAAAATADESAETPPTDQAAVLAELAKLHEQFEADELSFEEFSEAKERLIARLDVR